MSKDKATKQAKPETAADAKLQALAPQAPAAEAATTAAPAQGATNSEEAAPAQTPVVTEPAALVPESKGNPPPAPPPPAEPPKVYRVLSPIRLLRDEPDIKPGEEVPGEAFEHYGANVQELLASKSIELATDEKKEA